MPPTKPTAQQKPKIQRLSLSLRKQSLSSPEPEDAIEQAGTERDGVLYQGNPVFSKVRALHIANNDALLLVPASRWRFFMKAFAGLISTLAVAMVGCGSGPTPPTPISTPSSPSLPPTPAKWCDQMQGFYPSDLECQEIPGYATIGLFGPGSDPMTNDMSAFLPAPTPPQLDIATAPGPAGQSKTLVFEATVKADGTLDLTKLPFSVGRWLPSISVGKNAGTKLKLTVNLVGAETRRFKSDLVVGLNNAITDGAGGYADSAGCRNLGQFKQMLCTSGYKASIRVFVATPTITLSTEDTSAINFTGRVGEVAGAKYAADTSLRNEVKLIGDKPLVIAVRWATFEPEGEQCKVKPQCPPRPPTCKEIVRSFRCDGAGHYHLTEPGNYQIRVVNVNRQISNGQTLAEFSLHTHPEGTKLLDLKQSGNGATVNVQSDGRRNLFTCSREPGTGGGCSGSCSPTGTGAVFATSGGATVELSLCN